MNVKIPELSLVVLVGVSGSGKSTFARKHFAPTEVLSSDACRALVSDDENDQSATTDAFEVLHFIAEKRLAAGRLTVIDATNVQKEARRPFVELARKYHCIPTAIVFDLPERIAHERNKAREDRNFGSHVIRKQSQDLHRSLRQLAREGFRHLQVFKSVAETEAAVITREPLWNNRKSDHGPFDLIGDVHGCYDELVELLTALGYAVDPANFTAVPPPGRKAVFLGDLVDRGPKVVPVLKLAMNMTRAGSALCVPGNHDVKLMRKLRGRSVQVRHGLAESLEQLAAEPEEFSQQVAAFIDGMVSHYVLDEGKLVVAHAGMKQSMQGRGSGAVREFALFGETTGETDEFGLPVRYDWAAEYRGPAMVVYGHTPVPEPDWLNRTINLDTGCVFGGRLTALRYPERELVSVAAHRTHAESRKPFPAPSVASPEAPALSAQQQADDRLDLADVSGKRIIETRLARTVAIREENSIAALEVMSRFAVDPRWLIYLPPTMSPCETSREEGWLEHPREALGYYRNEDQPVVVCQEKHMGSRVIVTLCRDEAAATRRFGVEGEGIGVVYTRTGRRFFNDPLLEAAFLARVREQVTAAGLWEAFQSDWFCFDAELMPWSAKAQALIAGQYASVGAAGRVMLGDARATMEAAARRGVAIREALEETCERSELLAAYTEAYRRYCWPVESVEDLRLAPFHLLASEGAVHVHRRHDWHMATLAKLAGGIVAATRHLVVDLTRPEAGQEAIDRWLEWTADGGEGMVIKPLDFIPRGRRGPAQPAIKCRGREYLRIIYGPDYTRPEHLERLRQRGLKAKRSLALREFALGVEALERFVRREPLRRVHECVFGVLALESEPVDPRL
ncbi:MAG TPA: polynucleotide kinase-phosphatase [Chthoniobacteraceae bacterium]|nr:polynucleotide kinase-phosphatase [Chthoniobacteraceae bacterium]